MPTIYTINDFASAIPEVLKDDAGKLYPKRSNDAQAWLAALVPIVRPYILRAIERYSKDRPLEIVSDIASDGTTLLPLPVAPAVEGVASPTFDPDFSEVVMLEWPLNQQPPAIIDPTDMQMYRSPSGRKIMLTADTPSNGDQLRCTWTARHALDCSSIPDRDFYALVDYAASLAADTLASFYAQTGDPTAGADVVNYRSKSSEYRTLARGLRERYFNHFGIDESADGGAEVGPALAMGQIYEDMQSGVPRMIHTKYTR